MDVHYFFFFKSLPFACPLYLDVAQYRDSSSGFDLNIHTTWQVQFAQGIHGTAAAGVNV